MAEISQQGGGGNKGGKVRSKKQSTKIDMTPMVDLAFLLLTFFMLTTTFNKPKTMEIVLPEKVEEDDPNQPPVNEKKVVTVILGESDKVYWYQGITEPEVKVTNFSKDGIRKILLEKNSQIPKMVVLIKPTLKSKYKNLVDILDEMKVTNMQRFALVEITPEDLDLIKDVGGQ